MEIIKEKEKELGIMDDDNEEEIEGDEIEEDTDKYRAGGSDWELTSDLNQPTFTDPNKYTLKCPYCDKIKPSTMSQHNWSRHLNAKHMFKCKKCKLYFTRHQLLTDHIKKCNK